MIPTIWVLRPSVNDQRASAVTAFVGLIHMRLILIGPPAAAKAPSKLLSQRQNLVQIGTGDILREAVRMSTPLGLKAGPYIRSAS